MKFQIITETSGTSICKTFLSCIPVVWVGLLTQKHWPNKCSPIDGTIILGRAINNEVHLAYTLQSGETWLFPAPVHVLVLQ